MPDGGHPGQVAPQPVGERAVGGGRARVADAGGDAAAGGVDLLVAGALGAEVELADAVATEGGVGVAVDQPRDRGTASGVVDGQVAVLPQHLVARPGGGDATVDDGDGGVGYDIDLGRSEPRAGAGAAGVAMLGQVVDQQRGHQERP